jgi:hypothetical protein
VTGSKQEKGKHVRSRRITAVAGVAAAIVLGSSATASASTITLPGVAGSLNPASNTISVSDTACDDDSVYANWHTAGGADQKVANTGGCGTTLTRGVPIGDGTTIIWRVCVDRSWPTADLCSLWRSEKI